MSADGNTLNSFETLANWLRYMNSLHALRLHRIITICERVVLIHLSSAQFSICDRVVFQNTFTKKSWRNLKKTSRFVD